MQATAAERSLPPPSYADKARDDQPACHHRANVLRCALTSCRWRLRPKRLAYRARLHTRHCAVPQADQLPLSVRHSDAPSTSPLRFSHLSRPHAAVYEYWLEKRKRLGKPALRRLQPPPAVTDPNPFNVFRPREKLHRRVRSCSSLRHGRFLICAAAPTGHKRAGVARTTAPPFSACAAFGTTWTPRAPSSSGYSGGSGASVTLSSAKSTCSC